MLIHAMHSIFDYGKLAWEFLFSDSHRSRLAENCMSPKYATWLDIIRSSSHPSPKVAIVWTRDTNQARRTRRSKVRGTLAYRVFTYRGTINLQTGGKRIWRASNKRWLGPASPQSVHDVVDQLEVQS